jgi:ribosomal protein L11 methyltransferase
LCKYAKKTNFAHIFLPSLFFTQNTNTLQYIELQVVVSTEYAEILIAELAEVGYESFADTDNGFSAYIIAKDFSEDAIEEIIENYIEIFSFQYQKKTIEKVNWNEEWEKNYAPIIVANRCIVRATFHEPTKAYEYEIIITPKMSFGTGHHETTSLMLENQLDIFHQNAKVLDVGCGTGILAIMAHLLGANSIDAFDNDEWAVENTIENCQLNHCEHVNVQQGTIQTVITANDYNIILANINRNVLLNEISLYSQKLVAEGYLLLSGFYEKDMHDIEAIANQNQLYKVSYREKNGWVAIIFRKKL